MTLDQMANLGDFIGGVVVVITLFFLIYQIRDNTKSIKLSASVAWRESYNDLAGSASSVPELSTALKKLSLKEDLDIDDQYHLRLWVQRALVQTEIGLLMLNRGQLEKEIFDAIWNPMKAFLRQPEPITIYLTFRDRHNHFGPNMRSFVESELGISTKQVLNTAA